MKNLKLLRIKIENVSVKSNFLYHFVLESHQGLFLAMQGMEPGCRMCKFSPLIPILSLQLQPKFLERYKIKLSFYPRSKTDFDLSI